MKVHGFLMAKALAASVAIVSFFFAGANISIVALTTGAALLLTRRVKPENAVAPPPYNHRGPSRAL